MSKLKDSVLQTKRYSAYFNAKLTHDQLFRWLISDREISLKQLDQYRQLLSRSEMAEIELKQNISNEKLAIAQKVANFISHFPTVNLIFATGSLSVGNAKVDDDIDLMIVTKENTLWLTRLLVIPLVTLLFKRRTPNSSDLQSINNSICINLWLDETAISIPINKRNLYTAHEVLQALPLYDRNHFYEDYLKANSWTSKFLANAYKLASTNLPSLYRRRGGASTLVGEDLSFLSFLNTLAFKLQYMYMKKRITNESVSLHSAFFHPRDLSKEIITRLGLY